MERVIAAPAEVSSVWKWWICVLLLLATTINYMDRQTLSNAAKHIKRDFYLSNQQYGRLESCFGIAFACGAISFGFLADRVSVRLLYPTVLVMWSAMGFLTGLVESYQGLLVCRTLLGIFEAGHWPCALKTTQRLLSRRERTMGNSILQSGSSIGAIVTPLVMVPLLTDVSGSWRFAFQLIGAVGMAWGVFWLASIRDLRSYPLPDDPVHPSADAPRDEPDFLRVVFSRRFLVLVMMVLCINACWHLFRAWLPLFLQEGRGYSVEYALYFNSLYYVATDVGCIGAGALSVGLFWLGMTVHRARSLVFLCCALMTASASLIPYLPAGGLLLATLLVVGCGALGLFPCYYSFTQELTTRHQGKVSGTLGFCAWMTSPLHELYGKVIDQTHSYDLGMVVVAWLPLVAFLFLLMLWGRDEHPRPQLAAAAAH